MCTYFVRSLFSVYPVYQPLLTLVLIEISIERRNHLVLGWDQVTPRDLDWIAFCFQFFWRGGRAEKKESTHKKRPPIAVVPRFWRVSFNQHKSLFPPLKSRSLPNQKRVNLFSHGHSTSQSRQFTLRCRPCAFFHTKGCSSGRDCERRRRFWSVRVSLRLLFGWLGG